MPGSFTQLVFDGVTDGAVGVALDIMGAAVRAVHAGLVDIPASRLPAQTRLVSVDGRPVRTAAKRVLNVDGALSLRALSPDDVLVLPGLGMATAAEIDSTLARTDVARAMPIIARAAERGVLLAASCSATFVLGAAGVLDGRAATTTWWLGPVFAQRFPRASLQPDRMVVTSGRVFTAGSAFAHADLVLAILAHTLSPALSHIVAKYLVLDERSSQARYMVTEHIQTNDPVIVALERFIAANIARQLSVAQMARATATSPRTLARKLSLGLGITPTQFVQRLRIARAVHLIETTAHSVDEVAARVGYADAAAFRRVFRRETGSAPRARRTGDRQAAVLARKRVAPAQDHGL
jgi:transcriptional regulator GlxA family with amidase domain